MVKNIALVPIFVLATFSFFINTIIVSAQTDTTDNKFSLTLEQIYGITVLVGVLLAFLLERIGIIQDRAVIYRMLGITMIILTFDYFVQKDLIL